MVHSSSTSNIFEFILHDYLEDYTTGWCNELKEMDELTDNYVEIIDWSSYFKNSYEKTASRDSMEEIASYVERYIRRDTGGRDIGYVKIIAQGLGAHVAGIAARLLRPEIRINEIVALDPTGYLFEGLQEDDRLSQDDADNVVAIHTNDGKYGFNGRLGHWDLYANNLQPPCLQKEPAYRISKRNTSSTGKSLQK